MIYIKEKTFYLENSEITYAFKINQFGFLEHLYFGKKIEHDNLDKSFSLWARGQCVYFPNSERHNSLNEFQNECPLFGRGDYRESMLAFNIDGVRVFDFVYEGYEILNEKPLLNGMPSSKGGETLVVTLIDKTKNIQLKLFYTIYDNISIITRHIEINNIGQNDIIIDRAYSFSFELPESNYEVISLPGAHNRERFMERNIINHGIYCIDSKRGISSGQMNPFIAIVNKNTDEYQGVAYGFNLVYSGDFCFKVQKEENYTIRVLGGINDYDFSWKLEKNKSFVCPEVAISYSSTGLNQMSQNFHDLYRDYLINPNFVKECRPIVINNWEATYFDFNTQKLMKIIDSVEGTGINTFVLDDGWFGSRVSSDTSGLGDWVVNTNKVDLTKVVNYAHEKGLKFGLWFEPEMVNKDSDLYRNHPDWIINAKDLEACPGREQFVLDLSRKEVRDYIVDSVNNILDSYNIDYVKWDMNRPLSDNYSNLLKGNSKELHHRYVLGLYDICERIVNTHKNVFFEGCSSGGCRFDPAMLYYFPQIWTSDDSDAYMRTIIQYGTSLCYPISSMSCHVSAVPNHQCGRVTPMQSRGDIAHLGSTGYELDTTKLLKEEIKEITKQIEKYHQMEELVLKGDLYRLNNPLESDVFACSIVSKNKKRALLTVFRPICVPNGKVIKVYVKGLKQDSKYYIEELGVTLYGSTIENAGLAINLNNEDFASSTLSFVEVE